MPFDPVQAVAPLVVLVILVEMMAARFGQRFFDEPRDTGISLLLGIGNIVAGSLTGAIPAALAVGLAGFKLFPAIQFNLVTVAVCFVANDFRAYWGHRTGHRLRWAWADHVVHHSSQHFNYSTGLRLGWTYYCTPAFLTLIPLLLIGFPLAMLIFVHGLNLTYQFLMHTEHVRRMPRFFEYLMNTPSHHRAHHGSNARYLDCNFGCVFIVWDRIFGTFVEECDKELPRYGLVSNIGTFNLLRVATHEWLSIGRDAWRAKTLRQALLHIAGPPGWSPADGHTVADIERRAQAATGTISYRSRADEGDSRRSTEPVSGITRQLPPPVATSVPSVVQTLPVPCTMASPAVDDAASSNSQSESLTTL